MADNNQEKDKRSRRLQNLANWAQVLSLILAAITWIWPNPGISAASLRSILIFAYLVYVAITLLAARKCILQKPTWNVVRWTGLYLFTALSFFLVGRWTWTSSECNQITIAAVPSQISIPAATEDDGAWAETSYEIQAPDNMSMQILFHWARHLVNDGTRLVETASGRHFSHYDTRIPRGQTVQLDDGIWIDYSDVENVREYETNLMTHRLTFYMVSEQGYLCQESADIQVQITGLFPDK